MQRYGVSLERRSISLVASRGFLAVLNRLYEGVLIGLAEPNEVHSAPYHDLVNFSRYKNPHREMRIQHSPRAQSRL